MLRVGTVHGTLNSTQIEALAGIADELVGTAIELTAQGELLLHGVRAADTARAQSSLNQVGLQTASLGIAAGESPHAEPGLQHVELSVPEGRVTPRQLRDLARLARTYADCELRVSPSRNLVILNMPRANMSLLLREPLLRELRLA